MKNINKLAELLQSSDSCKDLLQRLNQSLDGYRDEHTGFEYLKIKSLESAEQCLNEFAEHLNQPDQALQDLYTFFKGPGTWADTSVKTLLLDTIAVGDAADYFNKNRTTYSFNKPAIDKGHARNEYFKKTYNYANNYFHKNDH